MKTISYRNQEIYTNSDDDTTVKDLEKATIEPTIIEDAYFFELIDRNVIRVDFDKYKVRRLNSGLYVLVNNSNGTAAVSIAGIERICSFLTNTEMLGKELSELKGRTVTSYRNGLKLLGIGIDR